MDSLTERSYLFLPMVMEFTDNRRAADNSY